MSTSKIDIAKIELLAAMHKSSCSLLYKTAYVHFPLHWQRTVLKRTASLYLHFLKLRGLALLHPCFITSLQALATSGSKLRTHIQ